jgi:hypothetical protein
MWKGVLLAIATVAIVPVETIPAQQSEPALAFLQPGTRVRVVVRSVREDKIMGTVTTARIDSVVIDTVDVSAQQRMFMPSTVLVDRYRRVGIAASSIKRVDVSDGRSRMRGAITFGLRGLTFGGLAVGLSAISGPFAQRRDFLRGVAIGSVAGLAIAAPIGYQTGVERWKPARSPREEKILADR